MYLALIAVNQYGIIRAIEYNFERFEERVYRDDNGRVLVRGNDYSEMLNAILFHVSKEFF